MQHSQTYVYTFVAVMSLVAALLLGGLFTVLKGYHEANEDIFNKRSTLGAIAKEVKADFGKGVGDLSDEEVNNIFANDMKKIIIDKDGREVTPATDLGDETAKRENKEGELNLFVYNSKNSRKYYILSVRGNGLWDEIWGNVAIEDDFNTLAGAAFDHRGETPGLGAEIKDNPSFSSQFRGKKTINESGEYTSVNVKKGGGTKNDDYAVDGLTGATVTADGVSKMLYDGLKAYQPYFNEVRGALPTPE